MQWDPDYQPRLRPVEALPLPGVNDGGIGLRDQSGLSDAVLTLSAGIHTIDIDYRAVELTAKIRRARLEIHPVP